MADPNDIFRDAARARYEDVGLVDSAHLKVPNTAHVHPVDGGAFVEMVCWIPVAAPIGVVGMGRTPTHPGEILRLEFLEPGHLTQVAVAHDMRIPTNRLNDIVRGRRAVTADTAWRLAARFGTSPEFWMNLQAAYDLYVARKEQDELPTIQA